MNLWCEITVIQFSRDVRAHIDRPVSSKVSIVVACKINVMSDQSVVRQESWDTMEDAGMVITDVAVLSKKEKAPQEYTVVSSGGG